MSSQLSPSPGVYKSGFILGIILCFALFALACWRSLKFLEACQRLNRYRQSQNGHRNRDDDSCSQQNIEDQDDSSEEEEYENDDSDKIPWWKAAFLCCTVAFCVLYFSGDYTHLLVLIVWVVVSLIVMFVLVYIKPPANEVLRQVHFGIHFEALLMLTSIVSATFVTVMTVHSHAMMTDIAHYDYFGPMRVTGVDATLDRIAVGDDKWVDEMRGQVQLEFGGAWACPSSSEDDSACVAVTWDDYSCNKIVCSSQWQDCSDDDGDAYAFSLECQENRHAEALALVDAGTEYDPNVPPKQDENNWPYMSAFGKCSTCEATRSPEKIRVAIDTWNMAKVLFLMNVGLLVITGATFWRRRSIQSSDNQVELIRNDHSSAA